MTSASVRVFARARISWVSLSSDEVFLAREEPVFFGDEHSLLTDPTVHLSRWVLEWSRFRMGSLWPSTVDDSRHSFLMSMKASRCLPADTFLSIILIWFFFRNSDDNGSCLLCTRSTRTRIVHLIDLHQTNWISREKRTFSSRQGRWTNELSCRITNSLSGIPGAHPYRHNARTCDVRYSSGWN